MSLWENIKSWFRSESAEARDWSAEVGRDLSADLDRREADLRATPAEKMDRLQEQISGNTDAIDEIRGRVESAGTDFSVDTAGTDDEVIDGDVIDGDV